ncbi:MAG: UDP-glucose 4-epimerase GalE, partial [Cyanobacteriota bacterium]|nr:UDP-glucose 4-epimerase GalE [Cyanobacteriota bacterium]
VVLDDFSNGSVDALRAVATLAGLQSEPRQGLVAGSNRCWRWREQNSRHTRLNLIEGDIRRAHDLQVAFDVLEDEPITAVLHFAGLKAVAESVAKPLDYWDVNVGGSRQLLDVMAENHCRTVVFSSSATVYGMAEQVPISEAQALRPINPYGQTKAAVEQMLHDLAASAGSQDPGWRIACLRYFNPVGAHESGRIGEDPDGIPTNLLPLICQVASGQLQQLQIYGSDWPTSDGTGVRDYIHVMDLAEGHSAALRTLLAEEPQVLTLNLGSGQGHSVLQMVQAFEHTNGVQIPYAVCGRRPGDSAVSVADPSGALQRLGWSTRRDLATICRDAWRWQQQNPLGYGT